MSTAPYNNDWKALAERVLLAWPEPELCMCRHLDEVLAQIRRSPGPTLTALLRRAQRGDRVAGRVVVQSLLPKLVCMSVRDPFASLDDYVAQLWLVLMRYPLHRTGSVAGGLALDTLKAVQAESRPRPVRGWVEDPRSAEPDPVLVIHRAEQAGLVSSSTGALLRAAYVEGRTSAQIAREHGLTAVAVRKRCSTALRKLARHRDVLAA